MNSPAEDDNQYVLWARQLLQSAGIDPKASGNYVLGFEYSFPLIQALRIAGELDGGVTRSNVILALRAMDMTHPMLLDGIKFNMSGNKDAYFIEGSDISKYDVGPAAVDPAGPDHRPVGQVPELRLQPGHPGLRLTADAGAGSAPGQAVSTPIAIVAA